MRLNIADPDRALLLDDGQSAGSLYGLPASVVLSARPQGESDNSFRWNFADGELGTETLVWNRYPL